MSKFQRVKTEEIAAGDKYALATGPFGSAISSRHFVDSGVPVIRGSNLTEDVGLRLNDRESLVFLSKEKADSFPRSVARRGDLIFTCWGTIGQVGLVDERSNYDAYIVSNKQMKLTPDPKKADGLFLYYVYSSPSVMGAIQGQSIGSSVPGFNLGQLRNIEIPLPPLHEQRRIAEILGALDDKIELNRKMNQTLEEMAQAIFSHELKGRDPIEGECPEGWSLSTLGVVAKESGGEVQTGPFGSQLHASDYVKDGIPSIMPKDLKEDRVSTAEIARVRESDAERLSRHRLRLGDIVYSRRGDVERRALIAEREVGWLCGTGCLRVRTGSHHVNHHFLYRYLGLPSVRAWIVRHAQGATMPNLNTKILTDLPFACPPVGKQDELGMALARLYQRRELGFAESETLSELRDTLLPKLIFGELRVRDVEKVVGEVA